jgi:thioredoxin
MVASKGRREKTMNENSNGKRIAVGQLLLGVVTLTIVCGVSGCSRAARWASRNRNANSGTVAIASVNGDRTVAAEKSSAHAPTIANRPNFVATGFSGSDAAEEITQQGDSATRPRIPSTTATVNPAYPPVLPSADPSSPPAGRYSQAVVTRVQPLITLGPNEDLDKAIRDAPGVVLIDFYADWCGPCRRQGKILHGMESQAERNNATIIKVNVDKHPALSRKYNVRGLPTLIVLKQGEVVRRRTGLASKDAVAALLVL